MGRAEGGDVVDGVLVDVDPDARAWVIGARGGRVRGAGALGVDDEPWLKPVEVAKGGRDGSVPRPGHVRGGHKVDHWHVTEDGL